MFVRRYKTKYGFEYFAHTENSRGYFVWSKYDAEQLAKELGCEFHCEYEEWDQNKRRKPANCLVEYEALL